MQRLKKRILSISAAAAMTLSAVPLTEGISELFTAPVTASAASGTWTNGSWSLDGNGKLTISGSGVVEVVWYHGNSTAASCPIITTVKSIVVQSGVTGLKKGKYNYNDDSYSYTESYSFSDATNLTSVSLPASFNDDTVLTFEACKKLTTVTLASGMKVLDNNLFSNCTALSSITLPSSLTKLGSECFSGCTALTSVTLPSSITEYGSYCFEGCTKLSSVTLPSNLKTIPRGTFEYCTALTSITLPERLESIAPYAFEGSGLKTLTTKQYLSGIGDYAFQDCDSLTTVTLTKGISEIGSSAFCDCDNLKTVTMPENLTKIGSYAFKNCDSLETVTLPEGLTSVGSSAFFDCDSLKTVSVSSSVTYVDTEAFGDCLMLESVKFLGKNTTLNTSSGSEKKLIYNRYYNGSYLYSGKILGYADSTAKTYATTCGYTFEEIIDSPLSGTCGTNLTWAYDRDTQELTVSGTGAMTDYSGYSAQPWYQLAQKDMIRSIVVNEGVTAIGKYAFSDCGAKYISLPSTLKTIGTYACDFNDFRSVNIPDSVTSIGAYAFYYCEQMTTVHISTGMTSIPSYAFYGCKALRTVTIPENITYIYGSSFTYANVMTDIYILNPNCSISSGSTTLGGTSSHKVTVHARVPSNAKTYVNNNSTCYNFQKIVTNECGDSLKWSYDSSSKTLTITGSGEMFAFGSFANTPWSQYASSIESLSLPEGLTNITPYAFSGLTKLTAVTLPASVTSVEANAFNCETNGGKLQKMTVRNRTTVLKPNCSACNYYYGYRSSTTEQFATDNNFSFIPIPNDPYCGKYIQWYHTGDTLYIVGTGEMYDYDPSQTAFDVPWAAGKSRIRKIVISDCVTYIGSHAFDSCAVEEIVWSSGLTKIGNYAFKMCQELKSFSLPDSVTTIGFGAFQYDTQLTSFNLPERITAIPAGAFRGCNALTSVTLPENIVVIGPSAFNKCMNLADVYILNPECEIMENSDASICNDEDGNFSGTIHGWAGSTAQTYAEEHNFNFKKLLDYTCGDNLTWSYDETTKTLTITGSGSMRSFKSSEPAPWDDYKDEIEAVVLPEGLTTIGAYAFNNCSKLDHVTIPQTVFGMGLFAFAHCTSLSEISLSDQISYLESCTFYGCSSLKQIKLPPNLTGLGIGVFLNSALTEITIPETVTALSQWALRDCADLKKITFLGNAPSFQSSTLLRTVADVYYPGNDATWTEDVRQNYGGELTWIPYYTAQDLTDAGAVFTLTKTVFAYTGKEVKCGSYVRVKIGETSLKYGQDFTLEYSDNVNLGVQTAKVTVVGMGNYSGTITKNYSIVPAQQAKPVLSVNKAALHVKWAADSNAQGYQVQYCQKSDFTGDTLHSSAYATKTECDLSAYPKAGETWYVRVRSYIKNSSGTKYGLWSSSASIKLVYEVTDLTLTQDVFAYTGKEVKIGTYVKVKSGSTALKYGTDFTMAYADNTACGINTAKITITGIGNYTGEITKTYTIAPAKQAVPSLTAISGGFKVAWTADANAKGYQVQYCKDSSFTGETFHSKAFATKTTCEITDYPEAGETWYVRVRSYISDSSGTKYGIFSDTASIVAG